jgi:MinD superfamily P-loop ATPase
MKEVLIISGKGGTGKTSLTASLATLAAPCVLADCDVDAADLHLLLKPEKRKSVTFYSGVAPEINYDRCVDCYRCYALCRYRAISILTTHPRIIATACEGCGVCADHCPEDAITLHEQNCGEWYLSDTTCGSMVHARLLPGAENSGKLVTAVREAARETAKEEGRALLLADGPPGIGCPVIAAMSGVDLAVIVVEPSMSSIHDMKRTAELARNFEIDFQVVINKADINPENSAEIEEFCRRNDIEVAGVIPYDSLFTTALRAGRTIMDYPDSVPAQAIKKIWQQIQNKIQ